MANLPLKTYDFQKVIVICGGVPISGFAEGGGAVVVEQSADAWDLKIGADGEPSRSKTNNKSGKITLKLMQTSDSNDTLNGFLVSDNLNNAGTFSVLITDKSGRSLHATDKAWIMKAPNAEYGADLATREWVLAVGELTSTFGGN